MTLLRELPVKVGLSRGLGGFVIGLGSSSSLVEALLRAGFGLGWLRELLFMDAGTPWLRVG